MATYTIKADGTDDLNWRLYNCKDVTKTHQHVLDLEELLKLGLYLSVRGEVMCLNTNCGPRELNPFPHLCENISGLLLESEDIC